MKHTYFNMETKPYMARIMTGDIQPFSIREIIDILKNKTDILYGHSFFVSRRDDVSNLNTDDFWDATAIIFLTAGSVPRASVTRAYTEENHCTSVLSDIMISDSITNQDMPIMLEFSKGMIVTYNQYVTHGQHLSRYQKFVLDQLEPFLLNCDNTVWGYREDPIIDGTTYAASPMCQYLANHEKLVMRESPDCNFGESEVFVPLKYTVNPISTAKNIMDRARHASSYVTDATLQDVYIKLNLILQDTSNGLQRFRMMDDMEMNKYNFFDDSAIKDNSKLAVLKPNDLS